MLGITSDPQSALLASLSFAAQDAGGDFGQRGREGVDEVWAAVLHHSMAHCFMLLLFPRHVKAQLASTARCCVSAFSRHVLHDGCRHAPPACVTRHTHCCAL